MTNLTRNSIFETMNAGLNPSKTERDKFTAQQVANQIINNDSCISDIVEDDPYSMMDVDVEDVTDETATTLWLSCSPGRDSSSDFEPSIDDQAEIINKKVKKHSKQNSEKSKHKRSSKEKPLSAYGMFFHSTQISIIQDHPEATFNEISEMAAKLWDNLSPRDKQRYFEKANIEAQKIKSGDTKKKKVKITSTKTKVDITSKESLEMCKREGCNNIAVYDTQWNNDFCSAQCVVTHCKDIFKNWVSKQRPVSPSSMIHID